jgi:hypothetical protein
MLPPPVCFIARAACLMVRNTPVRLTSFTACQLASVVSSSGMAPCPGTVTPAFACTTLRVPNVALAKATAASTSDSAVTSALIPAASPPLAVIASTTGPMRSPILSVTTTFAPSSAASRATSRPSPEPAPVMSMTLSCNRPVMTAS